MSDSIFPTLSLAETRVLGVLVEKQRTVPDSYPMTLNSLMAGCNQKTSRDPVLDLSEADIASALERLRELKLVTEVSGGRVTRYQHQMGLILQIPSQSVAILTVLMLRGPQTVGELRINCERLHKFSDTSAAEGFLNELAERSAGALVVQLPRQPGARENRWAHLLSGEIDMQTLGQAAGNEVRAGEAASLAARVGQLESELSELKTVVARLCSELGIGER